MRTKTLLCIAALTAAGLATSMAQSSNVFSLNIVGYANVVLPGGPGTAVANPFDLDGVNSADKVLNHAPVSDGGGQPGLDSFYVQIWNPGTVQFDQTYFEQDFSYNNVGPGSGNPNGATNGWATDGSGATAAAPPLLPPGKGFLLINSGPLFTNVFVGNVVPNPGATNTMSIVNGAQFYGSPTALSGSMAPLGAGYATLPSGPLHLPIPPVTDGGGQPGLDSFYVQIWNPGTVTFDQVYFEQDFSYNNVGPGSGNPNGATNGWASDGSGAVAVAPPVITIGQAFMIINPGASFPWAQSVTNAP